MQHIQARAHGGAYDDVLVTKESFVGTLIGGLPRLKAKAMTHEHMLGMLNAASRLRGPA